MRAGSSCEFTAKNSRIAMAPRSVPQPSAGSVTAPNETNRMTRFGLQVASRTVSIRECDPNDGCPSLVALIADDNPANRELLELGAFGCPPGVDNRTDSCDVRGGLVVSAMASDSVAEG